MANFGFSTRFEAQTTEPAAPALTLTFLFKQLLLAPVCTSCACGAHSFHPAVLKELPPSSRSSPIAAPAPALASSLQRVRRSERSPQRSTGGGCSRARPTAAQTSSAGISVSAFSLGTSLGPESLGCAPARHRTADGATLERGRLSVSKSSAEVGVDPARHRCGGDQGDAEGRWFGLRCPGWCPRALCWRRFQLPPGCSVAERLGRSSADGGQSQSLLLARTGDGLGDHPVLPEQEPRTLSSAASTSLTSSCLVPWGGLRCAGSRSLAHSLLCAGGSSCQSSTSGNSALCRQLWKRASLTCCSARNPDLGSKRDPKPGLLSPVCDGGTTLWFSLPSSSNSPLLALAASDVPAEVQPHPRRFPLDICHQPLALGPLGAVGHRSKITAPTGGFEPDKGSLGGPWSKADQIRGASEPSGLRPGQPGGRGGGHEPLSLQAGGGRAVGTGWRAAAPLASPCVGRGRRGGTRAGAGAAVAGQRCDGSCPQHPPALPVQLPARSRGGGQRAANTNASPWNSPPALGEEPGEFPSDEMRGAAFPEPGEGLARRIRAARQCTTAPVSQPGPLPAGTLNLPLFPRCHTVLPA